MEAAVPQIESEEARWGTAAHWVASKLLAGRYVGDDAAPNGIVITDEMLETAQVYVDYCGDRPNQHIEQMIRIPKVHDQCYGTPDNWWVDFSTATLYVVDFKGGRRPVDPEWCWQLGCYASGILDGLMVSDVVLVIVQPRAYGYPAVRDWRTNRHGIEEMAAQLRGAAINAMSVDPKLCPSPEVCRNCAAAATCSALQYVALAATDRAFSAVPMNLTGDALGRELRALTAAADLLNARLDGLEEQAEATIKRGDRVPGWTLQPSPGRLGWTVPDAEVISTAAMMGVDVARPATPITPIQARKKGLPDAVVAAYSQRAPGKMKLTQSKEIRR